MKPHCFIFHISYVVNCFAFLIDMLYFLVKVSCLNVIDIVLLHMISDIVVYYQNMINKIRMNIMH